jgi:hypothetical protein
MTAPVLPLPLALPVVVQRLLVARLPSMAGVEVTATGDGSAFVGCPGDHVAWNVARILREAGFAIHEDGRLLVVRGVHG